MRWSIGVIACLTLGAGAVDAQERPGSAPARVTKDAVAGTPTGRDAIAGAVEVDHVFIATRPGAPEAAALRAAGFRVPARVSQHTGGGTASVSILFENAYLELLYADSTAGDGGSSPAERAHWRRVFAWRESGASPFGVGLRRRADAPDSLPFPTERMPPEPWMPPNMDMRRVTTRADSLAPGMFVVPRSMGLPAWIGRMGRDSTGASLLEHPLGVRRMTAVRVVVAHPDGMPPSVRRLHDAGVLQVEPGAAPLVELTFDGGARGATKDLRPTLPLLIRY